MSPVKVATFALPLVSALMLAGGAANATESARGHYITFWGGSQYVMSDAVAERVHAHNARAAEQRLRAMTPSHLR